MQAQKLIHEINLLRKVDKVVCFVCCVEICHTMAPHIVLLGLAKSHSMYGVKISQTMAPHIVLLGLKKTI
jgi:hypothetical protein